MKKKIVRIVLMALALSVSLVACASPIGKTPNEAPASGPGLDGVNWILVSYVNSEGETVQVLADSQITAEFNAGEIKGNAGCNSYFGSYKVDGLKISVGPLGMTEMYCMPDERMAQESDYLKALSSARAFEIVAGELRVADDAGQTLLTYTLSEA